MGQRGPCSLGRCLNCAGSPRSRKPWFKDGAVPGDTVNMVALQAIVTAITVALVLVAARLTVEIESIDVSRIEGTRPVGATQTGLTVRPADS
jgi:hypothetical protein